jgi:hypothetical protein
MEQLKQIEAIIDSLSEVDEDGTHYVALCDLPKPFLLWHLEEQRKILKEILKGDSLVEALKKDRELSEQIETLKQSKG